MTEMRSYPRMKYHATQGICAVLNAEQDISLGESWGDSPSIAKELKEITYHEAHARVRQDLAEEDKIRPGKKQ